MNSLLKRVEILADCLLKRVGIPLYNGMVKDFNYGAYLRDPMPRKKGFTEKIWLTFGYLSMNNSFFFLFLFLICFIYLSSKTEFS